jgi:hypothetical protein
MVSRGRKRNLQRACAEILLVKDAFEETRCNLILSKDDVVVLGWVSTKTPLGKVGD